MARVADIVGDSTVLIIIRDLLAGPRRFGEFEGALCGVSSRTLTKKLRFLREHDIITKRASGDYALTPKGKGLSTVERAMRRYGERYL